MNGTGEASGSMGTSWQVWWDSMEMAGLARWWGRGRVCGECYLSGDGGFQGAKDNLFKIGGGGKKLLPWSWGE